MSKSALTKETVKRAVLRNEPVILCGLKFYGITLDRYEEWQAVKSVLLVRQSTLPVLFISLPFIDALFALDIENLKETGQLAGAMNGILEAMTMSLRLPEDSVANKQIRLVTHNQELKGFYVAYQNEMQDVFIPKEVFPQIREIIAWQQGEEVPDESLNDDLLEDEKWIAQRNAGNLDFRFDDLLASVALNTRNRISDLYGMSILEFEMMRRAIDRDKKYLICGIAENSGTKWKDGNPYPSWSFDRKKAESGTLTHISKFEGIAQK